jgi:sulfane dehydrogenase subunit SoxC
MSEPVDPSRRRALAAVGLGLAAAMLPRAARAEEPELPVAPDDPSTVLGKPSTPFSERSPFAPARPLSPANVLTGPSNAPIQDLIGTITPTDLQFQRHHAGIPTIDPQKWRLLVHGLVERPMMFTLEDLQRLPSVTRVHFMECSGNGRNAYRNPHEKLTCQQIDGLINNVEWTGVPLSIVLAEAGVRPEGTWVLAEGGDASRLSRSVPLEKALDDALLVYASNGEPLRMAHGYPMRLLLPGWEGNMSIKWLRRLELKDQPLMSRDEVSKYTDPLPGNRARLFSWENDVKSIITRPSHPGRLNGPGAWPISGLAWSGRGRVTGVEVSTDGGQSWQPARLTGQAAPKAVVRFEYDWRWTGEEAVIASRATDETGRVQPTVAAFVAARGRGTDYHFNAIRSWRVASDGSVFFRPDPELL